MGKEVMLLIGREEFGEKKKSNVFSVIVEGKKGEISRNHEIMIGIFVFLLLLQLLVV